MTTPSKTIVFSDIKLSLEDLFAQMGHSEQWLNKFAAHLSLAVINIRELSRDTQKFLTGPVSLTSNDSQSAYLGEFHILVGCLAIHLSHFDNNIRHSQIEFQANYQGTISRFKNDSIGQTLVLKKGYQTLLLSLKDIDNQLSIDSDTSSADSKQSSIDDENKENLISHYTNPKLLQGFTHLLLDNSNRLQASKKSYGASLKDMGSKYTNTCVDLNEQIINECKKYHRLLSSLFKSLLEETSNRFGQFNTQYLPSLTNPLRVLCDSGPQMSLLEYHKYISGSGLEIVWAGQYTNKLKKELQMRKQFWNKYLVLLTKYLHCLSNTCSNKCNAPVKHPVNVLGSKHPQIINYRTLKIVDSVDFTSYRLTQSLGRLVKSYNQQLRVLKQNVTKMEQIYSQILPGLQALQGNNYKKQSMHQLFYYLSKVSPEEEILNKKLCQSVSTIVGTTFTCMSEVHSRLLVQHETHFGLSLRDTVRQIKADSQKQFQRFQQANLDLVKLENVNSVLSQLQVKKPKSPDNILENKPNEKMNLQKRDGQFYCLYGGTLGLLTVTAKSISFVQLSGRPVMTIQIGRQQILKVVVNSNNTTEIHAQTIHKFNFFYLNKYINCILSGLFAVGPSGKQLVVQTNLPSPLLKDQVPELEFEEKQVQISNQELKVREGRLLDQINMKYSKLADFQLENTSALHLLNLLFVSKSSLKKPHQTSQFYIEFKQKMGETNLKTQPWSLSPFNYFTLTALKPDLPLAFTRKFQYDHPIPSMGIPFLPKTCKSVETQTLRIIDRQRFVVDTQVESSGAPYTDIFKLRMRCMFRETAQGKVKMQVGIQFDWLKKSMMQGIVQKSAVKQTKLATDLYVALLKQTIKQSPVPVKQLQNPKPKIQAYNLQEPAKQRQKNKAQIQEAREPIPQVSVGSVSQNKCNEIVSQNNLDKEIVTQFCNNLVVFSVSPDQSDLTLVLQFERFAILLVFCALKYLFSQ